MTPTPISEEANDIDHETSDQVTTEPDVIRSAISCAIMKEEKHALSASCTLMNMRAKAPHILIGEVSVELVAAQNVKPNFRTPPRW